MLQEAFGPIYGHKTLKSDQQLLEMIFTFNLLSILSPLTFPECTDYSLQQGVDFFFCIEQTDNWQGVDFFFVLSKRTIEKGSWVNLWAVEGRHNFFLWEILKIMSFSPPRGPPKKVGGPISM